MDPLRYRTWIIFYLISFTALLWALFLSTRGVMLWVSLLLDIIVMGVNGGFLVGEIRQASEKRARLKRILESEQVSLATVTHHR